MLTTDLSLRFDPMYEKISGGSIRVRTNSPTSSRAPGLS